jgi:hypothetical protein
MLSLGKQKPTTNPEPSAHHRPAIITGPGGQHDQRGHCAPLCECHERLMSITTNPHH